ncbi:MAG: 3-oxoacyl-ACP reductase FabG [Ruminococcaceae bacterium]|nr:3-oxoacyl-ACP reductase FabG [Oscillospiraceae bacterium]
MRRVIISGGTRGIGLACVKAFCDNGDRVAFIYKNSNYKAEEIAKRYGALPIRADISVEDDVKRAVEIALEALGGVDILVNNAGISEIGLFTDMSGADWHNVINTNLSGVFFMSRDISREMIKQKYGRIINIGSVWGRCGASCEVAYSASKAGVRGLTMSMAKELGPSGITVNCIEPGVIETDMNSHFDGDTMRELCDETSLCRIGKPEDVAGAVLFFASDRASFITGQILGVDGGFEI